MAERVIYIHQQLHTGQLKEATHELVIRGIKVTGALLNRAFEAKAKLPPNTPASIFHRLIAPSCLNPQLRHQWDKDELWLAKFLMAAKSSPYYYEPTRELAPVSEKDTTLLGKHEVEDYLIQYWRTQHESFKALDSSELLSQIGSIRWARSTYIQSRLIRRAIFDGNYTELF